MSTRKRVTGTRGTSTARAKRGKATRPAKGNATSRASSSDDSNPLSRSAPGKLAGLMQLNPAEVEWRDDDLAAILKHQLAQPLAPIVAQYMPAGMDEENPSHHKIKTFGDLFASSAPPAELLDIVRKFARDCRDAGEKTLPSVIAGALYWSAIAAAIATSAGLHSKLSKTDIEVGLKWLSDQKWLTPQLHKLAKKAS